MLEEAGVVVIAGNPSGADTRSLVETALCAPDPAIAVLRSAGAQSLTPAHPGYGKGPVQGRAAAYLCRRAVCGLPVTDPVALQATLRARAASA
jgi:uncharacterized protein YyaL (SSP411 family)